MARPTSITDEQILEAARAVFLEKGIQATTAEVARRAGVAEGSIFNRFKTKQALFQCCMATNFDDIEWLKILRESTGKGDVEQALTRTGLAMMDFFRTLLPIMMMSWSNTAAGELPPHLSGDNPPPVRALREVAAYFEAAIAAGHLPKEHKPEIMARMFMGSIHFYCFTQFFLKNSASLSTEEFVHGIVKLIASGAKRSPKE